MFYRTYRLMILGVFLVPIKLSAAIIEKNFVEYEGGAVSVHYTYDDVTNLMQQVIIINPLSNTHTACGQYRKQGAATYQAAIFVPRSTPRIISVPQTGVNAILLHFDSKGRPDNIDGNFSYPFDKAALNPDTTNPCADY